MTRIVATAPGKVLLSGEYAVLDGASAICLAVDRRAIVTIETLGSGEFTVVAPGWCGTPGVFALQAGRLDWRSGGEPFGLFEGVWNAAGAAPDEALAFELDTRAFRDDAGGVKTGIGSSAALSVALATALSAFVDCDVAATARDAHRSFQQGSGSGVDVATSFHGGVIEYRMDGSTPRQVGWPAGIQFAVLWSGVAADTQVRIERLRGRSRTASRRELARAANEFAARWQDGDCGDLVAEGHRYTAALRRFDVDQGLGIFDAGHARLADAAAARGVVYKPSGAGGGDVGIAFGTDAEAIGSFVEFATGAGFRHLELALDLRGAIRVGERPQ